MNQSSSPDAAYIPEYETTFLAAQANYVEFTRLTIHIMRRNKDGEDNAGEEAGQLRRAAMLGNIAFSAITLEAAINFFGKLNGVPYYSDIEKTLSPLNKWRIFPRLVGREPVKEHILDRIKLVFQLRDRVVHPKPVAITLGAQLRFFMPDEAAYLLNTVDIALEAIGMDPIRKESRIYLQRLPVELRPDKDIMLL